MSPRTAISVGCCLAALAVGLGAFGAHGLDGLLISRGFEAELAKRLAWFETGVRYHFYHALGMILAALVAEQWQLGRAARVCPVSFLSGILLFSGSLYGLALMPDEFRWLGAITPLGGVSFIASWLTLAWAVNATSALRTGRHR